MTIREIEALIGRLGNTNESAVAATANCGDPDIAAYVRSCEEGYSGTGSPRTLYPVWLRRLVAERDMPSDDDTPETFPGPPTGKPGGPRGRIPATRDAPLTTTGPGAGRKATTEETGP